MDLSYEIVLSSMVDYFVQFFIARNPLQSINIPETLQRVTIYVIWKFICLC